MIINNQMYYIMKKILFVMAVLFGCSIVSVAQTNFIATLQHEGEFTHYYGAGALSSAYNAATEGDIITLSPGTFTWSGTFNKGITLRGAGVEATEKTYISNEVNFASTDETKVTIVEGIKFNSYTYVRNNSSGNGQGTIKFIKCTFNGMTANYDNSYSTDRGPAVRLYNCSIYSGMSFEQYSYPDFLFYNCYVEQPSCNSISETRTFFVNCVINWKSNYYAYYAYRLHFYNCIFNWTSSSYAGSDRSYLLPSTATCYNCLSINKSTLFNDIVSGGNNKTVGSAADVFVTYTNTPAEGETFELTDAAKEAYIGTDGTQIGMQGGNYPYTTTVQYPVVTKLSAEPQTNKEGILNIEVEVDGK